MDNQDYHQILQFSNHGIVATDEDGLITFINKRAKTILQFGKKRIVGRHIEEQMPKTGKLVADCLKTAKRHCRTTRDMAKFLNISQPSVIRKLKKHRLSPNLINKRIKP